MLEARGQVDLAGEAGLEVGAPGDELLQCNLAAEAAVEGIVLETTDSAITLQTRDGIETVAFAPDTAIRDETGGAIAGGEIGIGQLVLINGQRQQETIRARIVDRQPIEAIVSWCAELAPRCAEAEQQIVQLTERCQQDASVCEAARLRLQDLRRQLGVAEELRDLRDGCERGRGPACRDLQSFCDRRETVCRPFAGWLRDQGLR